MRHPPLLLYAFAIVGILVAICSPAIQAVRALPNDVSFLQTAWVFTARLGVGVGVFVGLSVIGGYAIERAATFRPGNRVTITGGDFAGSKGYVAANYQPQHLAFVLVTLMVNGEERTEKLSRYNVQKRGFFSYLF